MTSDIIQKVSWLQPSKSGEWSVEQFEVSEADSSFTRLRAMLKGRGFVPPGTYTKLTHCGSSVMSDTPDELRDHNQAVRLAFGNVLVAGLGLGIVLNALLMKDEVEHVTMVEIDPDVIHLVWPAFEQYRDRLTLVQADIFKWKPARGEMFDVAWFDIWSNLCTDHLPEMTTLKRRFAKRVRMWKGCWCEGEIRFRLR